MVILIFFIYNLYCSLFKVALSDDDFDDDSDDDDMSQPSSGPIAITVLRGQVALQEVILIFLYYFKLNNEIHY